MLSDVLAELLQFSNIDAMLEDALVVGTTVSGNSDICKRNKKRSLILIVKNFLYEE